jgi:hypothetical protein
MTPKSASESSPPSASTAPVVSLDTFAQIFGTDDPPTSRAASNTGPEEYRAFVRRRLADRQTYVALLTAVFPATPDMSRTTFLVHPAHLKIGMTKTQQTFYYRRAPCDDAALERVQPWWDPSHEVLVCHKDYRPELLFDGTASCDVVNVESSPCGCGPSLMFCGTDDQEDTLREASLDELRDTLKYVIESDKPFGDMLTMTDTVHSGLASLIYARVDGFMSGKFVPPDPNEPASLHPRTKIHRGGILSTPFYLWADDARATIVRWMRDVMCLDFRARGVDTHRVLVTLKNMTDLRGTLMVLAKTEGCQNCHAALENLQVAYSGWHSWDGMRFTSAPPDMHVKLYFENAEDLRGEGPADLTWLGNSIASQPEFARCTTSKVLSFIYEGREPPTGVARELTRRFRNGFNMRALIEDAVVARAFGPNALGGTTVSAR